VEQEPFTWYRTRIGTTPNECRPVNLDPNYHWRDVRPFAHECFLWMQLGKWLRHERFRGWRPFPHSLWAYEACFTGVFSVHKSHLWARNGPETIRGHGNQVKFSVKFWSGTVGDVVLGPYLLPDRMAVQECSIFFNFHQCCCKMCLYLWNRRFHSSTTEPQHTLGNASSSCWRLHYFAPFHGDMCLGN
jgi:hypothetical protein